MITLDKILSWFSSIICKNINWISFFALFPLAFESYMYFFDYDNMYEPYALYFQNYSEINWVAFIFLMGYFKEMKYIGKVSVTGIFFVLIVNTIQLHIGFSDTAYFVIYIGFIYLFLFIAYIWELFRYIEKSFER